MAWARRAFLAARAAATTLQAARRGQLARRRYARMLAEHRAALAIQAAARGHAARQRRRAALSAALSIQMAWRRQQLAARVSQRQAVRAEAQRVADEERAAAKRAAEEERAAQEREQASWEAIQREFGMAPAGVRQVLGLWQVGGGEGDAGLRGGWAGEWTGG